MIAQQQRLTRRWLSAMVQPQPVLQADQPWEGRAIVLYGSVLPNPPDQAPGWRMYYSNFVPSVTFTGDHAQPAKPCTMLAQSHDGLTWHKPALTLHPHHDQPTNIVHQSGFHWDSPSVMYDPSSPSHAWKMIGFGFRDINTGWEGDWGLHAQQSSDGLHWKNYLDHHQPVLKAGDRSNLMSEKCADQYVLYTRHRDMFTHTGSRAIYRCTSPDFLQWTEPELVLKPDLQDAGSVQFYGMPVFRRHGWYLGLLEVWEDDVDSLYVQLTFSRDGIHWSRPANRSAFIGPSYDWNRKWSTCSSQGPILLGEQMVFYFGGRHTSHHWDSAQLHGAIGYASLPADRFCALEGKLNHAFVQTPLLHWPGGDLILNADTRQSYDSHPMHCDGQIRVEIYDDQGQPLPAWSGTHAAVYRGNTHCRGRIEAGRVLWPDGRSLDQLSGQLISMRLYLNHARLFTLAAI